MTLSCLAPLVSELGLGGQQKEIAARWKALSEEEKKVHEDAAKADKERYAEEVAAVCVCE